MVFGANFDMVVKHCFSFSLAHLSAFKRMLSFKAYWSFCPVLSLADGMQPRIEEPLPVSACLWEVSTGRSGLVPRACRRWTGPGGLDSSAGFGLYILWAEALEVVNSDCYALLFIFILKLMTFNQNNK